MPYADKEKQREFQRLWLKQRRSEFLSDKRCAVCGSKEKLQVDHIDRTKKTSHRIWSWTKEKKEAELAKCQILCFECHISKTRKDMGHAEHNAKRYREKKCLCEQCELAYRAYNKKRYQTRKAKLNGLGS